ncbi:unnamed protein product [Didymodactylos carnosus]|uniref:Uncharacterized protein n=1 Tax=Didymodactylos carnosus TaxID=1234261 RepID=A0A8S2G9Q4_9BILA|nr:unnamed protein product [Didymodactylos carnosus]CAF4527604.1 unnamed protein product [Didymodactylos carnosus]
MDWLRLFIEHRLFLKPVDYSCIKDNCNYIRIPDSPLYLSKSIRIRQIRAERGKCHSKIIKIFRNYNQSCYIGSKNIISKKHLVISGKKDFNIVDIIY